MVRPYGYQKFLIKKLCGKSNETETESTFTKREMNNDRYLVIWVL